MNQIRFGILTTGNIANQFARGVAGGAARSVITAVGSRSVDSARAFAERHGIPGPGAHGGYDALINDPNVDAVYNALPNLYHKEWTLRALAAGKHVLCEKPMGMDAVEVAEMFDAAGNAGKLLCEAFMYRTHPQTLAVLKAVRDGAIGEVKLIRTTFCYRTRNTAQNTRFHHALGGGAIMDIGCYCVDFANQLAGGLPESVHATGRLVAGNDGGRIDVSASGVLNYANGAAATFTCAMDTQASNLLQVCGDEGYIEVPVPWKPTTGKATWALRTMQRPKQDNAPDQAGEQTRSFTNEAGKPLYALEADAFATAAMGEAEPFMTADDSIGLAKVLDELRRQVGVVW